MSTLNETFMPIMKVLDDSAADSWDNFVDTTEGGGPFHLHEWLHLCERHQGAKLIKLVFYAGEELVCIFPIFIKRFLLFRVAASSIVVEDTPYMGPVLASERYLPQIMDHLDVFMRENNCQFFRFIAYQKLDLLLLEKHGFKHFPQHTHVLDLHQGIDTLWKKMEGRARTAIRKAEASGVRVSFVDAFEYLDQYYDLYVRLYAWRNKTPPNSKSFFCQLFTNKLGKKIKMVVAHVGNLLCAAAIFVHYKDTVYYLDAVTDKEFNKYNGSSAIQWHVISWAADNGYQYYDFVGSNHPWLAKFKASFGGKLQEYHLFEKASSEWVFFLRELYGSKVKPVAQRFLLRFLR